MRRTFDESDADYERSKGMVIQAVLTIALIYTFMYIFLGFGKMQVEHILGLCTYLILAFFLLVLPKIYKVIAFVFLMIGTLNILAFTPNFFFWRIAPTEIFGQTFTIGIQPFSFLVLFVVTAIYWTEAVSPLLDIVWELFVIDQLFDDDRRGDSGGAV